MRLGPVKSPAAQKKNQPRPDGKACESKVLGHQLSVDTKKTYDMKKADSKTSF